MPSPFLTEIEIAPPHPEMCESPDTKCNLFLQYDGGARCVVFRSELRIHRDTAFWERCQECLEAEREAKGEP
jgi:hypothetical protein